MKKEWYAVLFVIVCLIGVWVLMGATPEPSPVAFSTRYTLAEFARANGVTPGKLKEELGMRHLPGRTTLSELSFTQKKARRLILAIRSGYDIKIMLPALICFSAAVCIAMLLLAKKRMSSSVKCCILAVAVLCFGFLLGKTYNPMVSLVKTGKALAGIEPGLYAWGAVLLAFVLLAVIGNKAVCGWACPYGALQELLFKMVPAPVLKKKIPFSLSNSVRCILFVLFITGLLSNFLNLRAQGRAIYHGVNPFNLFEFNFTFSFVTAYIAVTLFAGVFFYRPHCYLVCPFGLISWILEKLSFFKVRINRRKCTGCGACVKACPGRAMEGIYNGRIFPADCFSCGECLGACPCDALSYSLRTENG